MHVATFSTLSVKFLSLWPTPCSQWEVAWLGSVRIGDVQLGNTMVHLRPHMAKHSLTGPATGTP